MQNISTKLFLSFYCLTILVSSSAQTHYDAPQKREKKQSLLVVHILANDFTTANYLQHHGIGEIFSHWTKLKDMNFGFGLNYLQNLTDHISFSGRTDASFTRYEFQNRLPGTQNKILVEADAGFNFKMLPDRYVVIPYLHTGIGGSLYDHYFGAYIPLGAGLQFTISKGTAFVFLNAQYTIGLTGNAADHFNFSVGVGGLLTKGKSIQSAPKRPVIINMNLDTDGDGIPDNLDSCPTVPGLAKYQGCPIPDFDYDAIADDIDKCPTQPGLAKYSGCPIPDTDGDGINDESDSCITQRGIAKYKGCPIPDTDGDSINDELDECPTVPGTVTNYGCPEVKQSIQSEVDTIAHQIFFATGSAVLLPKSFSELDKLAGLLKGNAGLGLDIEGHTDNTGSDALNIVLSQHRAEALLNYLIKKGIDKKYLHAKGYGSTMPIANNNTVEGKSLNRRVELKIKKF